MTPEELKAAGLVETAPGEYTHEQAAVEAPKMAEGFDPVKLGLTELRGGGGPSGGEGQQADSWANGWAKDDPTDSNMQMLWDSQGNYLGSKVKQSGWVSARPAVIQMGKMALSALTAGGSEALGLSEYLPSNLLGMDPGVASNLLNRTTMNTVMNGGDIGAGFKNAALGEAGNYISGAVSGAMPDLNPALSRGAGTLLTSVLTGQDPTKALVGAALSTATDTLAKQIPGWSDMSQTAQNAARTAITGVISGQPLDRITQNVVYGAINSGVKAATSAGGTMPYNPGTGNNLDTNPDLNGSQEFYGLEDPNYGADALGLPPQGIPGIEPFGSSSKLTDSINKLYQQQINGFADQPQLFGPTNTPTRGISSAVQNQLVDEGAITADMTPEEIQQAIDDRTNEWLIENGGGTPFNQVTITGKKEQPYVPWEEGFVGSDVLTNPNTTTKTATPKAATPATTTTKTPATPQTVAQAAQDGYMPPIVLVKINKLFEDFGPEAFSGMSIEDLVKSVDAGDTPTPEAENPIYAAQGGSIDDLIEYLRR